jgi:hypothetical protein
LSHSVAPIVKCCIYATTNKRRSLFFIIGVRSSHTVNFFCEIEIKIRYPAAIVGCDIEFGVAPAEFDIWVMIGGLGEIANLVDECQRVCKIREFESFVEFLVDGRPARNFFQALCDLIFLKFSSFYQDLVPLANYVIIQVLTAYQRLLQGNFKMRFYSSVLVMALSLLLPACTTREPSSPKETFKTYTKAIAAKDTTTMKLLLSSESLKMHADEAKAQNVSLEEIVKRETLFTEGQKKVEFKDEKIDGDKATLEVKDTFGNWQTLPFVFEDDQWKIDKKNYIEKLGFDIEQQNNQALDDVINQGRIP